MHQSPHRLNLILAALLGSAVLLAACGGGSDSPAPAAPAAPAATTVSGVAAVGAALAGATVTLIDSDPATTDPAPVVTAADGSFSVVVDGLRAPYALRANFILDGEARSLYAVLPSATAASANTANVTPLTNVVAVLVAPAGNPASLTDPATLTAALSGGNAGAFTNAVATLNAVLSSDPAIAAVLAAAAGAGGTFNPVTTTFAANGTGVDGVLDQITVTTNPTGAAPGTVQIQNNAQAAGAAGVAPPIVITPTTTPATAPTLPPTASGDLPTAADLDAVASRYNTCYALPAAQRVTATDADGVVTAGAPACAADVADWKSNGYDWWQSQSASLLNTNLNGAQFRRPLMALVVPPANRTAANEFKHSYCNTAQCVIVDMRGTMPAASNQPLRRTLLLAKVGGTWKSVGNQRPYDFDIQYRLSRMTLHNAAPLTPTSYFSRSRYEAQLRLQLNPSGPAMNGVRAARVSGPGLPAAGVVLSRSSRCTSDRMPIVNKMGDTYVVDGGVNQPRFYTNNASIDFKVGAALLDGSDLPAGIWPAGNVDFASVATADAVLPYGEYKWEFFFFGSVAPTQPDLVTYQRLLVSNTDLNRYVDNSPNWWAALSMATIADYLSPTGAKAGAQTAASLSWTVPSLLGRVDTAFLFSSNVAPVNGVSYNKRTGFTVPIAKPGDSTASITGGQTIWVSGVSTSSFTAGIAAAQNPRCAEADKSVTQLAGVDGDYRETTLTTQLTNGVRLLTTDFWQP